MYNFKIIFCIFVLCQVALGVVLQAITEGQKEHEQAQDIANVNVNANRSVQDASDHEAALTKVNWKPVVCAIEVQNAATEDFIMSSGQPHFISPIRNQDAVDSCAPPNGLGLRNLLEQASALLPYRKLQKVLINAQRDSQVVSLRNLLDSEDFRRNIKNVLQSRDFIILRDYICHTLNLDLKYYSDFVRNLIDIENVNGTISIDSFNGRKGIRGLLLDLHDVLPKHRLRDTYERLMETDEYLVLAVRRMKSDDFQQLLKNVRNLQEVREINEILNEAGVPLYEVKELIDIALGWQGDEFGGPNFEMNI